MHVKTKSAIFAPMPRRQGAIATVAAAMLAMSAASASAEPSLVAETTSPSNNFFAVGSAASATLKAKGMTPNGAVPVDVVVFDFTRTNAVAEIHGDIAADGEGCGTFSFDLPTDRYGIFYVSAEAGWARLPKVGTAPEGFFTYGVLEDPSKMPDIDPWDAFLGLHGGSTPWLWQRGGFGGGSPASRMFITTLNWSPCDAGRMGPRFWTMATNEAARAEYRERLSEFVGKAVATGPGRQGRRIYEPLWEPNLRAPSPEAIVAAQKVAWETIHALDPDALVGAYTASDIDLRFLRALMERGLGQHMNALTVHPYCKDIPEKGRFIGDIRNMKHILREYMGRDIPLFATESGMNEDNSIDGERRKLYGQLRQSIILLGEGFQFHMPFYGSDYGADNNDQSDGDYGLQYNSQYPKVRFGCKVSQPRPIFGALAAFGRLTEGHRPTCAIEWLAETVLGYACADKADRDVVLILWDWGGRGTTVEIPVGREEIDVADVMGNVTRMAAPGGTLRLTLSELPQYILHADPAIWGREAQQRLNWSARRFKGANELAPVGVASFTPAFAGDDPGVAVTLENRTGEPQTVKLETRIPGEPLCRKRAEVEVPANGERRVEVAFEGFRPDPVRVFEAMARVVPREGTVAEMKASFNFLPIPGAFDFDGCHVELDCDGRYLHFDATVEDATPATGPSGWWSWNADSMQIALAREALRERTQNDVADAFNEARCEYTVAKTEAGDEVCRTISWDLARFPCGQGSVGVVDAATAPRSVWREGDRWRYRVSIPWEFVNLASPAAGTAIRFAVQTNDRVPGEKGLRQTECFRMKVGAPGNFGWGVIRK